MMRIFWERTGEGGWISVTWGLFVIKGHPCQNDPGVVSSFTSGMGWQGQGEDGHGCHHPLASLGMSPTGATGDGAVVVSWITPRGYQVSGYPSPVQRGIPWRLE